MALFQTSVLKSHLALLNDAEIEKAYKKYQKYFWNTAIQENIKIAKEEQYQATFLNEFFVNILGYTLFPNPNPNLTTEFKNEKNARKADGAILKEGVALGVIELKGTKTKDLESIRRQAFDYKANQKGCVYVITSNFEKLRFYINDATEFEEFDLFTLSKNRFELLYLCLHIDNVLNNVPLKIKEASIVEEEEITKAFYKDYSIFKRELYRDLVKKNAKTVKAKLSGAEISDNQDDILSLEKNVKLTLFKKSQKLIDRFLFIFFAEDRTLLPSNSTLQILNKWKDDWDFGDERPLYNLFKQYFNFLDLGRKGTEKRAEIYAYNGGLFKPDNILDALDIDNNLLYTYALKLSKYDFESQVDVNILGHIFENSLNEIESVNAEIEGGDFDKQKSKRKKDGVFYTPKYITKYIVENTVGKLCEEKKTELGFQEEEYFKGRAKRPKKKITELVQLLDDYREWLLKLTICDPACGSGAFLNQALDFLIKEHHYIDELKAKILGGGLVFSDIETTILENNIYGVDLNDESVEIAKLSLWLRTAQPRRKLNDLSSNIKCGNSLIESKAVAGDKAFHWETAFEKVFEKGGFDIVIGNPPYVSSREISENQKNYYYKKYKTSQYRINLYTLFCELVFNLLKPTGVYSYIIPNYWLSTQWDSGLRKKLTKEHYCREILNTYEVFQDVNVDTLILTGQFAKTNHQLTHLCTIEPNLNKIEERWEAIANSRFAFSAYQDFDNIDVEKQIIFGEDKWLDSDGNLGDALIFTTGMQPYEVGKGIPVQTQEMRKNKVYHSINKIDETYLPLLGSSNVQWMLIKPSEEFIKYGPNLSAMRDPLSFKGERILVNRILGKSKIDACLITENDIINNSDVIVIRAKNEQVNMLFILAIITSKYCAFSNKGRNINLQRKVYPKLNVGTLKAFPLPQIEDKDLELIQNCTKTILTSNKQKYELVEKFNHYLMAVKKLNKISRKLKNWQDLEFGDFIEELNKAIKATNKEKSKELANNLGEGEKKTTPYEIIEPLTKKDEFEWMELFEENKKKAQELQSQINQTEKEIDAMVYELYWLTEEEIAIIENS